MTPNTLKTALKEGIREQQEEAITHFEFLFDKHYKKIEEFDEIVEILILYAIENKSGGEIVEEVLDLICRAQGHQGIQNINFDAFAENLHLVSGNVLFKYIEILSYTYNPKYIPDILKYRSHKDPLIRQGVEDALIELRYES